MTPVDTTSVERFAILFRGLTRAHGIYTLSESHGANGAKVKGKAQTVRMEVTQALWDQHLSGTQGLGIVPINDEGLCWFGAIDIDRYDIDIQEVEGQCAALGLPLLPTRSKSGGIHLYLFTKGVGAQLVRTRLEEWARVLGFGGSEVFPKQSKLLNEDDVGNWINMPYFKARATERYGIHNGERLTPEDYISRAEKLRVNERQLQALTIPEDEDFEQGPPCLQALGLRGFAEGQRNKGMFAIGVYLKKRFPDNWEPQLAVYNAKYMHPPLEAREISTILKSLARKEYNYACSQDPIKSFCNRELCLTRRYGVAEPEAWTVEQPPKRPDSSYI